MLTEDSLVFIQSLRQISSDHTKIVQVCPFLFSVNVSAFICFSSNSSIFLVDKLPVKIEFFSCLDYSVDVVLHQLPIFFH